jgi:hypothetical protein
MAVVGLAVDHFLPHPNWNWRLVARGYFHCRIRFDDLRNVEALQKRPVGVKPALKPYRLNYLNLALFFSLQFLRLQSNF